MGTIKQGILGGFSGKVGTVVGASWKGISYMRSLPQKVKNPRTDGQMSQRTKFALTLGVLKPMTALLRTGWKLFANKQTPFNAAMSYTLANAITGAYPDYEIDPAKVLVSRGALTTAANASVKSENGNIIFSWDDNSGVNSAKQTDKALIAVLNPAKGEAITDTAGAERSEGTQTLALPADWADDELHTYLGFISEDGKEIASSVYLGVVSL
ncbi:DUF6266 family protein [Seramator thermalis]|uniref:DUF6266 family protein n=1 Tax=Seramator thermalis TaxID=2496270 RepID=UPI00101D4CAE|nr:DUF6266 family protein [Seramator thermalis]